MALSEEYLKKLSDLLSTPASYADLGEVVDKVKEHRRRAWNQEQAARLAASQIARRAEREAIRIAELEADAIGRAKR